MSTRIGCTLPTVNAREDNTMAGLSQQTHYLYLYRKVNKEILIRFIVNNKRDNK